VRGSALLAVAGLAILCSTGCGSSSKHASGTTTATTLSKPSVTITLSTEPSPGPVEPTITETAVTDVATSQSVTSSSKVVQQSLCPSEQTVGLSADFGHRKTRADANALLQKAAAVGFKNLVVERRGCNDFAVVLHNLQSHAQARDLQDEARSAGFAVTLDCRSHPIQGGLAAVFGHRRTRAAAMRLQQQAAAVGFQGLQVQQDTCDDWEVDLYGLKTPSQRRDFLREARSVGLHVTFEPG
jgi:cell division septation protein DedD